MTSPRAAGTHLPYPDVPDRVRRWVDDTLGSPVVAVAEQAGGMSPGCVTRLTCADGTRAFVKAVGAELNPRTPELYRREAAVHPLIGRSDPWAGLVASYDDGDWVALLLEDVEGTHPDLADDREMDRLLAATDALGAELARRVPERPATGDGLADLTALLGEWADVCDHAEDVDARLLPGWAAQRGPDTAERLRAVVADDADWCLVNFDIRNDNLLVRADGDRADDRAGDLVFLDWGAAGFGPDWFDPLLARLERVESPWFDHSLGGSPALRRAGDEAVTAWLLGFGTFLAWRVQTAVDVNLPTLQAFRVETSRRLLAAVARRSDLGR